MIRSKWGPSGDVYDHPPDVKPYLQKDGPDADKGDYNIYERDPNNLDKEDQEELKKRQDAYDKIEDKSGIYAHGMAARLCQFKNRLKKKK
jgi:hypothetical protein